MIKQKSRKVISFILCLLMLTSLFNNASYYPHANNKPEGGVEIATFSDAVETNFGVLNEGEIIDNGESIMAEGDADQRELPNSEVRVVTYVNGVETSIADAGVLKNGDQIKVLLSWSISNISSNPITADTDLTYNLNATGIAIGNSSGNVLRANVPVGDYFIDENGVIHIKITDTEFLAQSDISGEITIDGLIDVSKLTEDDNGQVKAEIARTTITVQKSDPTAAPTINKQRNGSVYTKDGKNYQNFKVTVNVNGNADEIIFTDTLGDYLKLYGSTITVNGSDAIPEISGQELKYTLSDVKKGDTYTITYRTEIVDDAFSEDYGWYSGNRAYYNDAIVEDSNSNSAKTSIFALQNKTWISKSNVVDSDKSITWSITVNSGDAIDISGATVTDNIPVGLEITGNVVVKDSNGNTVGTIDGSDFIATGYTFPDGSVGQYTLTYVTTVTENSAGLTDAKYTNTATIKADDYNINKQATSTATINNNWVTKSHTDVDLENKLITWQTKITVPSSQTDPIELTYYDVFGTGLSYNTGSIAVSYDNPSNVQEPWTTGLTDTSTGFNLKLGKVTGPIVITITYKTDFDPGSNRTFSFTNKGYISDGDNDSTPVESTYKYQNSNIDILQYKYPKGTDGTKSTWGIQITNTNSQQIKDAVTAGNRILIYDSISFSNPDGSALGWIPKPTLLPGSIKVSDSATSLIAGTVEADGTIVFDLTDYIKANPNSGYYELSYTVDLDGDTIRYMIDNNISELKEDNSADAYADDGVSNKTDIGHRDGNGSTYPKLGALLTKSYSYTSNTAPYAKYSIDINPSGLDLVKAASGTLTLEDVLGADLQLKLSSVAIVDKSGNSIDGIEKNYDSSTRTLTIKNIPDATPCYLTYDVFVDVPYEPNTSFASLGADVSNSCKLFANDKTLSSKEVVITGNVQQSSAWASSNYGAIIISKYSGLKVLKDAEFTLTAYKYDQDTDTFVINENYEQEYAAKGVTIGTVATGEEGTKSINLLFDTLYRIDETKAPQGYVGSGESLYVLIKGQDYSDIANAITSFESVNSVAVDEYTSGSFMYVENEPESGFSINVSKKDQKGTPVKGAEFTLYKEGVEGSGIYDVEVMTLSSNSNGRIMFTSLAEGIYLLKETSAPYGYEISKEYKEGIEVIVDSEHPTVTLDVENTKIYGTLIVNKHTTSTLFPLEGVEFSLYLDEQLIQTLITDAKGQAIFNDLELDKKYELKETATVYGYNLIDSTWDYTPTQESNTQTLSISNYKQQGRIRITKVDKDDSNTKIANVVFTLYDKDKMVVTDGNNLPVTATTNSEGVAEFTGLPYDTFYVRETSAPDNYIIDDTYHKFDLKSDEVETQTITNQKRQLNTPFVSFKIFKKSNDDAPLPGASFKLYRADGDSEELTNDNLIYTAISDVDGYSYFLNINDDSGSYPDQVYTLVESSSPYGYYYEENKYTFKLSGLNVSDFKHDPKYTMEDSDLDAKVKILTDYGIGGTIVNYKITGEIKFTKTDENKNPLAGAVYGIYLDGVQKGIGTSDENGVITFRGLQYDKKYIIKEITPPNGYSLSNEEISVVIGDVAASSGFMGFTQVVEGVYKYEKNAMNNELALKISKRALTGTSELKGAKLSLLNTSNVEIDSWTSGSDAHIVSSDKLEFNSVYTLVETEAPAGYGYSDPVIFKIESDGKIKILSESDANASVSGTTLTMKDKDISFSLAKVDPLGNKVSGAELQIKTKEGSILYSWNSESGKDLVISSANTATYGITVPDIPEEYKEYVYHEESAPQGYIKANDISFYLDYNGNVYLKDSLGNYNPVTDNRIIMVDEIDITDILISKIAMIGNTGLSGAELLITDKNGNQIEKWTTTDSAIKLDGDKFKVGEIYTLTEIAAPTGYACTDPITFTINSEGKVEIAGEVVTGNHIYMEDALLDIKFSKLSTSTGEHLSGAEIIIESYDNSGNPDKKVIVEPEGSSVQIGKYLKPGYFDLGTKQEVYSYYVIYEAKAPFGYERADEIRICLDMKGNIYIYDEESSTYVPFSGNELIMYDDPIYFKVNKLNEDNNNLVGAKLQIKDSNGEEVYDSWISGNSAKQLELSDLKPHTAEQSIIYTLVETQAPFGYEKAADIEFYFDVDGILYVRDGNNFTKDADGILSMTDKRSTVSLSISKVDLTNGNELAGASLTITDGNGNVIEKWISTTDIHQIPITSFEPDKEYTLTEVTAPEGYEIAESIKFKLDGEGNVYVKEKKGNFVKPDNGIIVMKDAPSKTTTENTTETTTEGTTEDTTDNTTEITTTDITTGTDKDIDNKTDTNNNTSSNNNSDSNTARTGDNAPIAILIVMMLISALGFAIIGIRKSRRD